MIMVDAETLEGLLQQAIADKTAEPAFLRALLEAKVYAHVPRNDRSTRVRFIQFTTPDGLTVLPFFSDEAQAREAAGTAASIVVLSGRQLLEATRGATLMLNPNTAHCTLYPEEIAALLDHGAVAIVERIDTGELNLIIEPPSEIPGELIDCLLALYAGLACVEAAYVASIGMPDNARRGILVGVAVSSKDAERVARATTTALQAQSQVLQATVDLTAFEPGDLPDWIKDIELKPIYERAWGERLVPAPEGMQ